VEQVRFAPTTNQNAVTYTTIVGGQLELKLRPGMTNANIVIAERKNAVRISNAALRFRPPEGVKVVAHQRPPGGKSPVGSAGNPPPADRSPACGAAVEPKDAVPIPANARPGWRRRAGRARARPESHDEMRARFAQGVAVVVGSVVVEEPIRRQWRGFAGAVVARSSEPEGPRTQTVYLVEKEKTALAATIVLKAVTPTRHQ
jgi:hypothetical protein